MAYRYKRIFYSGGVLVEIESTALKFQFKPLITATYYQRGTLAHCRNRLACIFCLHAELVRLA